MDNPIWTQEDENILNVKLKHLIKILELKKNKLSLQEYLKFLNNTKNDFERGKYLDKLKELLEIDDL